MNVEYINPFLNASAEMLKVMCSLKMKKLPLFIKQGIIESKNVTITIGINGDLQGNLILNLDKNTALTIASRMMGGMEIKELDELAASAVSELGNMIAGHSGINFSSLDKNIDITPPVISINTEKSKINYATSAICVPIEFDTGDKMEIDISIM